MGTRPRRTLSRSAPLLPIVMAVASLGLGACETERRVISVKGGLSGIQGAQGQELSESQGRNQPRSDAYADLAARRRAEAAGESETPTTPGALRITREDGTVSLVMTSPRHVVIHLRQTLVQNEPELLFDQILSDRAKQVYRENSRDPHEAVEFLFENQREVLKMLQRMPQGEFTPGMFLKKIGPSAYRLELSGANGQGLRLRRLDVVWEQGVCKLLAVG